MSISTLAHILKQAKIPIDKFLELLQERTSGEIRRGTEVKYG